MYKEYHDIPYNSKIEEAIIGSFSLGQLAWLAPAAFLSFQLSQHVPLLPFVESDVFSRIHWFLPIIIAVIFIKVKHPKTNLTLSKYMVLMIRFKFRRKRFHYRRVNISKYERSLQNGGIRNERNN